MLRCQRSGLRSEKSLLMCQDTSTRLSPWKFWLVQADTHRDIRHSGKMSLRLIFSQISAVSHKKKKKNKLKNREREEGDTVTVIFVDFLLRKQFDSYFYIMTFCGQMHPDLWSPQGSVPVLITRPQIPPSTTELTTCTPPFLNSSSAPSLTAATPGARSSACTVGSHATKQPPAVFLTRVLVCLYSAALCDHVYI